MQDKPYYPMFEQLCRSNGWVLGQDKGEMVVGVGETSVVINDFQDPTGQAAIRMWAPVAPAGKVPHDQAMQMNGQLPHVAFATLNGQTVMTATRVLNMTSNADLGNVVAMLAYYAGFYGSHYNR